MSRHIAAIPTMHQADSVTKHQSNYDDIFRKTHLSTLPIPPAKTFRISANSDTLLHASDDL